MLLPIRALHTTISASTHHAPTNNLFTTASVSKLQMVRSCKPHTHTAKLDIEHLPETVRKAYLFSKM